ncbi:quinone oxidoreductase family protein [Paraburkholderia humisilvae]|uniref:Quinone oxidoreductase 1 n=1 Tax=Paraburkholderia humisilvae TaxID=627669 RepID=A0A6J5FBK3_9BURK|nr:quinone oxidoreductase [Paraburkholderia humisilvae]CAB3774837.1 Quinone oxidoreductase 1 [Paraburkholderia humisilvae]
MLTPATTRRVIRLNAFGDPSVLQLCEEQIAPPAPGEVQLRQVAIGFNYIDVYQRSGKYPLPLPTGLGHEAAGIVDGVGHGVADFRVGDRVIYMNAGIGAYTDRRNVEATKLTRIPGSFDEPTAVAVFFKAMTAEYLLRKTYPVKVGDIVLIHAAAGGVGQILCQWAKAMGAYVIGTAGSDEKCRIARESGCDHAINYNSEGWVERVVAASDGRKAHVVYDSVGRHTFLGSLDCAAKFGTVVVFGAASGPTPSIDPEILNNKGCLFLTRPSVFPHNSDTATFRANADAVFEALRIGWIKPSSSARFTLDKVADAHTMAERRENAGAIVILP